MYSSTYSVSPPPCFGNGRVFDNEAARCQACVFNRPCRQEVIAAMMTPTYAVPAPVPATQFFNPNPVPVPVQAAPSWRPQPWTSPVAAPAPTPWRTAVPPAPVAPPPMAVAPPAASPLPPGMPYSPIGYYGYSPDPLFQVLAMVPPMWRPQHVGETFGMRVAKNLGLTLLEQMLSQMLLATRQAFLPPPPPRSADSVVDVTPTSG